MHRFTPSALPSKPQSKAKPVRNSIILPFENGYTSLIDSHKLLSILVGLEDQLWAMTQSDQVPSSVKELWISRSTSRLHTAYGRLSSLITLPGAKFGETLELEDLAEMGMVNTSDKYGKLQHFQEFRTELENVF